MPGLAPIIIAGRGDFRQDSAEATRIPRKESPVDWEKNRGSHSVNLPISSRNIYIYIFIFIFIFIFIYIYEYTLIHTLQ